MKPNQRSSLVRLFNYNIRKLIKFIGEINAVLKAFLHCKVPRSESYIS